MNMSLAIDLSLSGGSGGTVPANAITLDDGTPVVDDAGNYVTLG